MSPSFQHYSRWTGPALLTLGAAAVAALLLTPVADQGKLVWWLRSSALAPERILPLIGTGIALVLAGPRLWIVALAGFGAGIVAGFVAREPILAVLAQIPDAPLHQFRVGPIACIAAGLALIPGASLRSWLLLPAVLVVGATFAVAINLTDPSFHDATIPRTGVAIGFWITAGIALTGRAFRRRWFVIAGRILGSWLVAIGLLYGGATLTTPTDEAVEPSVVEPATTPEGPAWDPSQGAPLPNLNAPTSGNPLGPPDGSEMP